MSIFFYFSNTHRQINSIISAEALSIFAANKKANEKKNTEKGKWLGFGIAFTLLWCAWLLIRLHNASDHHDRSYRNQVVIFHRCCCWSRPLLLQLLLLLLLLLLLIACPQVSELRLSAPLTLFIFLLFYLLSRFSCHILNSFSSWVYCICISAKR